MGYLNDDGLTRLWAKIKAYVDAHVGVKGDKGDKGDSPIVSYSQSGQVVRKMVLTQIFRRLRAYGTVT